jgi:hypothetical protein
MSSKGVTDRQRVALEIVAATRTHARAVGERLQEILAPAFPGELVPFDLVEFQEGLARYLEMRTEAIIEADEGHLDELLDDNEPRRRRDEARDVCYSALVGIRDGISAAFGRERTEVLLGYKGTTEFDPLLLEQAARRALRKLRNPPPELPPARLGGIQVDLAVRADELQPALDELSAAIMEVKVENKEANATLRDRDLELDAFDAAVGGIGRITVGFDELAGFRQFADRVRLSRPARRRAGIANGEPSAPEPEETPETESSPVSEPADPSADLGSEEVGDS